MQRLTFKDGRGRWTLMVNGQPITGQIADRLAAYENIKLEPEEIMSLKKDGIIPAHWSEFFLAECEDRLMVLPCRIGDKVWCIRSFKGIPIPKTGRVEQMYFSEDMRLVICVRHIGRGFFGEKVFLSRQEALKAIEARKQERRNDYWERHTDTE